MLLIFSLSSCEDYWISEEGCCRAYDSYGCLIFETDDSDDCECRVNSWEGEYCVCDCYEEEYDDDF